jgi:Molybdopterin-binding domain of aldehyde dehydrogenase
MRKSGSKSSVKQVADEKVGSRASRSPSISVNVTGLTELGGAFIPVINGDVRPVPGQRIIDRRVVCLRVNDSHTNAIAVSSQVRGGVVWGIGAALREASEVDPRYGGFLNADLAEYVLPVNSDIGSIDVEFIDEPDFQFNSAGAKGLGEVSMTGVAPAIANAVFHATGRRLRDLPIRVEHLF